MPKKGTPGDFQELISAGLGGFVNQFLEVPNHQNHEKKKNNPEWGNSLRRLPWDSDAAATESERLISSTLHERYDAKHPEVSLDEIALINSLTVKQCPYCGSKHLIRCGHYGNGIQRYQCRACDHRFNPLTNTIFEDKKYPYLNGSNT